MNCLFVALFTWYAIICYWHSECVQSSHVGPNLEYIIGSERFQSFLVHPNLLSLTSPAVSSLSNGPRYGHGQGHSTNFRNVLSRVDPREASAQPGGDHWQQSPLARGAGGDYKNRWEHMLPALAHQARGLLLNGKWTYGFCVKPLSQRALIIIDPGFLGPPACLLV